MTFFEMKSAVDEAQRTMHVADRVAEACADILVGRLRKCGGNTLRKLKRELRDFNMTTWEWKER